MGALTLRDNLYKCTSNSFWVCLIEGRFLVSKRGRVGFTRKSDAALAFKNSDYWDFIVRTLKTTHKDQAYKSQWGESWCWNNNKEGKLIEDNKYKELLKNGTIVYSEIKRIPDWANI